MKVYKVSAASGGERLILLAERNEFDLDKLNKNERIFIRDAKRLVELFGELPKGTVDKFFKIYQKHQDRQRTRL